MSSDHIWPILFFVSLAGNLILLFYRPLLRLLRRGEEVSEDEIMALVEEGEAGEQLDLFAAGAAPRRDKLEKLEKAMDGIRDKFGRDAIAPASTVHRDRAEVKAEQRLPPVD